MNLYNTFQGSMIGGAIGDALGGEFENEEEQKDDSNVLVWGEIEEPKHEMNISDDTQLTLATAESIIASGGIDPEAIAQNFLTWYQANKLSGLGSATLQSLRGMLHGGHWALVGKKGETAAGNGAAMRIAPLAFWGDEVKRESIRDVCRITHHNDEAYVGALAVYLSIRRIIQGEKMEGEFWLKQIANQLPDTQVTDRILAYADLIESTEIAEIAQRYGSSGYVVESVPLALFGVAQAEKKGFSTVMQEIIASGGDTDTNASIFGQIAGARIGYEQLPRDWVKLIEELDAYSWIAPIMMRWEKVLEQKYTTENGK